MRAKVQRTDRRNDRGRGFRADRWSPDILAEREFTAKVSHAGVTVFSSSTLSWRAVLKHSVVLAMAIKSDFNKTFRRIARLFYWFPKSLTCSKNRKSKLLWSQGRGKLSEANASFEIHFFLLLKWSLLSQVGRKNKVLKTFKKLFNMVF